VDWCLLASFWPKAWTITQGVIAVGLLIFVHELGHFLAAKACGVKCEKFYIGFDIPLRFGRLVLPSAFCRVRWGETEYGVGILPLGGYVKMLGQDDNPAGQKRENERIKVPVPSDAASPAAGAEGRLGEPTYAGPAEGRLGEPTYAPPAAAQETGVMLDPRSYPAKPVWQRMIIISAGVIMNLVTAVVFAAVAYGAGITYIPCIIGGTTPGDPAWVAGLDPGDKIIQLGRDGRRDEHLRFDKDLIPSTMLNGAQREMDLLVRRNGQSEPEWMAVKPTARLKSIGRPATLGVRGPGLTRLARALPDEPRYSADGYRQLRSSDEIVAADGQSLPRDAEADGVFLYHLERVLAQRMTEPITLTVQRPPSSASESGAAEAGERFDVVLPPARKRVLGLTMQIGPVVGVRRGTPAEQAGFRDGDLLVSIQGQDVGDPLTLPQRLLPLVGQEIEVRVQREAAPEPVVLRVTPQAPSTFEHAQEPGAQLGLESLGVAVSVSNVVAAVEAGSPADRAGLRAGDVLLKGKFLPSSDDGATPENESSTKVLSREVAFDGVLPNWFFFHETLLQMAGPDQSLKLTYQRGQAAPETVTLEAVESERWFDPSRGLIFRSLTLVYSADSLSATVSHGLRETKEKSLEVLGILKRLLTRDIPVDSMGGPFAIFDQASREASKGLPSLLLFLTLLSANLAVLNLLPIPALDGGHLIFLTAEWVRGKPVDERLQITLTLIGITCLLTLMVLVCYLDFDRYLLR
jgi:regulator of sigma E protease